MITTTIFETDLRTLRTRKMVPMAVHIKTPLWLKRVLKSKGWFLEELRLIER